jgi:hypothetical protein
MFDKILKIYPQLTFADFSPNGGTILLQNDSDGKGDYIAFWRHPIYPKPTDAQLAEIN